MTIPDTSGVGLVDVYPASSPQSVQTASLVDHLRRTVIPARVGSSRLRVYVGGSTAVGLDFADAISSKLALFILIVGLSVVVLASAHP
jgi:RND superfamily putative drug exporter